MYKEIAEMNKGELVGLVALTRKDLKDTPQNLAKKYTDVGLKLELWKWITGKEYEALGVYKAKESEAIKNIAKIWGCEESLSLKKTEEKIAEKVILEIVKNLSSEQRENLANAFEIPWIRALYKGKLNFLEKNLKDLKRKITSTNLKKCFEELPLGAKDLDPIEIVKKIKSIKGEICICGYLKGKKGFKKVEKIKQYGDWKCDDKIVVSAKRKESISAPYEYVESIIKALAYIEENEIVRKYNKISLSKLDRLGYRHLNLIYKYLRNYLVQDLQELDKKIMNGMCWNATKSFSIDREHSLKLEISVNPRVSYPVQLMFFVNRNQNVEINFRNEPLLNKLQLNTTTTDKDAFFDGEKIEIKEYIEEKIDEVCGKEKRPDILWIDVLLHPRYEEAIKKESDQAYFRNIINSERCLEVKTILSFTFDYYSILFAEPVILE